MMHPYASSLLQVICLSPALLPWFVAARSLRPAGERLSFAIFCPIIGFLISWLLLLIVILPAYYVLAVYTPSRAVLASELPFWFPTLSWIIRNELPISAVVCVAVAVVLTRVVWKEWQWPQKDT
jgi:hypothetical protein